MTDPLLAPWIQPEDLAYTPDDQVGWATARIREYCNWHIFPSVEQSVELDTNGGRELVLPTLHLTGLGAVVTHVVAIGDDDVSTTTDTVVDPGVLFLRDYGVVERRDWQSWPWGPGSVSVTFTHGYDSLPEALRWVAVAVALRVPREMKDVIQETAGGMQVRYAPKAPAVFTESELSVLNAYQLPVKP